MAFYKHVAFSLTISLPLSPQTEFPFPYKHVVLPFEKLFTVIE